MPHYVQDVRLEQESEIKIALQDACANPTGKEPRLILSLKNPDLGIAVRGCVASEGDRVRLRLKCSNY